MAEHNKLMAKYHERLKAGNKATTSHPAEYQKEPEKAPKHINPFKKGPSLTDEMLEAPAVQKSSSNMMPSYNFDSMRSFNSSNEFVRFTTEIIPNIATYNSIAFPIACVLKPLGSCVSLPGHSYPGRQRQAGQVQGRPQRRQCPPL